MSAPAWSRLLLRLVAPRERREEVLGDLDEAHARRVRRSGRVRAALVTGVEALDVGRAMLLQRLTGRSRPAARDAEWARPGRGPVVSLLDFKLGVRMLVRYPGLTFLGGVAMAFAIFVGAGAYEFMTQVVRPDLPLPQGDRVVGVRLWHSASGSREEQSSFDLQFWRRDLRAIEHVGAYRTTRTNLITDDAPATPEILAEMNAAGFQAAGVGAALGRTLVPADEAPGAEAVVVIGHRLWQERLGGDPNVVGRVVKLGDEPHTIVGVMPEGYRFPVAHHLWRAARFGDGSLGPRQGPSLNVFGRLAPGATMEEAQRELDRIGAALTAEYPHTHEHIRPQVLPYALSFLNPPGSFSSSVFSVLALSSNLPLVLFLVLVAGNVALLMFARAAAREGELIVRSALGASRARIIGQLVAEALVLCALSAAVGLAAVQFGLRGLMSVIEHVMMDGGELPFWFQPHLSLEAVLYACGLAVLAAAVAGGLPGLKVTRNVSGQLRQTTSGGGGFRFGGVWTALIVSQIALTMIFPVLAAAVDRDENRELDEQIDVAVDDYLVASLQMGLPRDPGVSDDSARALFPALYQDRIERLQQRIEADPRVRAVTFTERVPRGYHPWRQIEVEGASAPARDERGHRMGDTRVSPDYFEILGVTAVAGRTFHSGDLLPGAANVIVNESFVETVLGGQNAVGRRLRYRASEDNRDPNQEPGPWLQIVGVVPDLGTVSGYGKAGIYHPAAAGTVYPSHAVVHVAGGAEGYPSTLLATAYAVDPRIQVDEVSTLARVTEGARGFYAFWKRLLLVVSAVGILLSLGGIYSVMSFTVAQRTREIGIRMALGSSRKAVMASVFRRPLTQVALGLACGGAVLAFLLTGLGQAEVGMDVVARIVGYILAAAAVCALACVVPTRRALAVEPGQALRADG